jgi:glucose/arabinose dehydrogenase
MFRPDLSSKGLVSRIPPEVLDNGYVFVHYAFNGASIIARITVDPKSPDQVTKEHLTKTVKVLMNIPQPYYNHYGGMIAFGPDRKLYIGKGDAGWEGDPLNAGQNLNVLWGKLLRSTSIPTMIHRMQFQRTTLSPRPTSHS